MIPRYNPLKSPVEAHVHKTTYGPLIDMAVYVMLLMRENPLLGQVGGGWPWKSQLFIWLCVIYTLLELEGGGCERKECKATVQNQRERD
jgi:hypothetical protein